MLHRTERESERKRREKKEQMMNTSNEELYAVKRLSIKKHFDAWDRYYPVVHCA